MNTTQCTSIVNTNPQSVPYQCVPGDTNPECTSIVNTNPSTSIVNTNPECTSIVNTTQTVPVL